jgi:hypothetical protein
MSEKLKRWMEHPSYDGMMQPADDGEWVRYEDIPRPTPPDEVVVCWDSHGLATTPTVYQLGEKVISQEMMTGREISRVRVLGTYHPEPDYVAPDAPNPTPPDEVADVVRLLRAVVDGHVTITVAQVADIADRLSRYTPGETEEVRLLRERVNDLELALDALQCEAEVDTPAVLDARALLDALAELEGRNG